MQWEILLKIGKKKKRIEKKFSHCAGLQIALVGEPIKTTVRGGTTRE